MCLPRAVAIGATIAEITAVVTVIEKVGQARLKTSAAEQARAVSTPRAAPGRGFKVLGGQFRLVVGI
jgi:hypothetical protein